MRLLSAKIKAGNITILGGDYEINVTANFYAEFIPAEPQELEHPGFPEYIEANEVLDGYIVELTNPDNAYFEPIKGGYNILYLANLNIINVVNDYIDENYSKVKDEFFEI